MDKKTNEKKVIPLYPLIKSNESESNDKPLKHVAAYCRVSSESDEQLHSMKSQVDYYKQLNLITVFH